MAKKKIESVTTVAIKENKVEINAPEKDVYSKEMITELNKCVKIIRAEKNKVESSFWKIGFNLYLIYSAESFKALGYKNVYSFAKSEFDIERGTTNNFINVVERFGKRIDGQITGQIADEYKDYKSSHLISMLGMSEKELEEVTPDMSTREIKKLKKKDVSAEGRHNNSSGKDSDSGDGSTIDVKSEEINRTAMITFKSVDDYLKHRDTMETMINRAFIAADKAGKKIKVELAYTW